MTMTDANWRGRWPGARVWQGRHQERGDLRQFSGHPSGVLDASLGPALDGLADVNQAPPPPSLADRVAALEEVAHSHDAPATDLPALDSDCWDGE
jgi:hypothetical protein